MLQSSHHLKRLARLEHAQTQQVTSTKATSPLRKGGRLGQCMYRGDVVHSLLPGVPNQDGHRSSGVIGSAAAICRAQTMR